MPMADYSRVFEKIKYQYRREHINLVHDYQAGRLSNDQPLYVYWQRMMTSFLQDIDSIWANGNTPATIRVDLYLQTERIRCLAYKHAELCLKSLSALYPELLVSPWEIDRAGIANSTSPCADWVAGHVALVLKIFDESYVALGRVQDRLVWLDNVQEFQLAMRRWDLLKEDHEVDWSISRRELAAGWFETAEEAEMRWELLALFEGVGAHSADPVFG